MQNKASYPQTYNTAIVADVEKVITLPKGTKKFTIKLRSNVSFKGNIGGAGETGTITAFEDYGGTVPGTIKATCTAHGLDDGDQVVISGSTSYNGTYTITLIDANSFYFTDTYVGKDITAFEDYSGTVPGTVKATCTGHGLSTSDDIIISGTENYDGTYTITKINNDSFYFTATYMGGSITAFADGGSGKVTVTSAGHGLSNGDSITISGTTNYNGTFTVSSVATDTFKITDTWVSDDATGVWIYADDADGAWIMDGDDSGTLSENISATEYLQFLAGQIWSEDGFELKEASTIRLLTGTNNTVEYVLWD